MTFDFLSLGIQLIEQFGKLKTGIWLFRHGSECMILEMPDCSKADPFKPWIRIEEYIEQEKLRIKFITATHAHGDHFNTYLQFHEQFPNVPIIVNQYFFRRNNILKFITANDLEKRRKVEPSITLKEVPIFCFQGRIFETNIAGEPLFLIWAPKHSWSDTMIIFRGSMITGDWWLGPGDPNPNRIPIDVINDSIDFLTSFCYEKQYRIHTLISVHANEFQRGIDFLKLMEDTRP